jgi:hypothetical protein
MRLGVPSWMVRPQELSAATIRSEPVDVDLRNDFFDWDFPQPSEWDEPDEELMPFMNYAWPLPGFDRSLNDTNQFFVDNMASVMVGIHQDLPPDRDTFLFLTGGGYDLSWDIAFGHMGAGFLPPSSIRLSRFCDTRPTRLNQWIVRGLSLSSRMAGVDRVIRDQLRSLLEKDGPPPHRWKARPGG